MFEDIRIFNNGQRIKKNFKILKDKIKFTFESNDKEYKLFYDNNVYNIEFDKDTIINKKSSSEIYINPNKSTTEFYIKLNDNFFIKSVFKYINGYINDDFFIDELGLFNMFKKNKELNSVIEEIKNIDNKEDIILNSNVFKKFSSKMSSNDLMLLITWWICSKKLPSLTEEEFNDVLTSAINSEDALENVWRLAYNYDCKGYNYDLVDKFFIDKKDTWYIGEYISAIQQVNVSRLVLLILNTKNKKFIKKLLEEKVVIDALEQEYIDMLKDFIKN